MAHSGDEKASLKPISAADFGSCMNVRSRPQMDPLLLAADGLIGFSCIVSPFDEAALAKEA